MGNIVLEIPEELNPMVEAVLDVLETTATQVKRGKLGAAVDYAGFEQTISAKLGEVERKAHRIALMALDIDASRISVNGVAHARVLEGVGKEFMTLAGPEKITRSLWRPVGERNAPVVDLIALRSGAVKGVWLPATAREMAYDVQQLTSREAQATGARRGRLPYSHTSFEEVAHAVGERYVQLSEPIAEAIIENVEIPEEACTVSASLDRVSVPMEEPLPDEPAENDEGNRQDARESKPKIRRALRMAYCGTVTLHDGEGKALRTLRYGTMPNGDAARLCGGMASDVLALLGQRPDLQVGLLCDGAPEMWNLLDAEFTRSPFGIMGIVVARLIDFWHAIEKLAPAAKLISGGEEAGKPLLARWKLLLKNSSSARAKILSELHESAMEEVSVGTTQPVHEAITYFTNNEERMDYATARRYGYPIGSGNVEATCKSLVEVRMKRAGSRWKTRTGEHIIRMRALALSDQWDDAMDTVLHPPRIQVRPIAA